MPAKLGLLVAALASTLALGIPAHADETSTTTPTTGAPTTTSTTVPTATPPPPTQPTPTNAPAAPISAAVGDPGSTTTTTESFGPAVAGQTPTRGTQHQINPPPPPPTTLAPWDPFLLPANSGSGRRAVYSKSKQTVWALDANNQIIKAHRVSGKQTPLDPRPGTYQVWSRSRYTYSINNPSITWGYMVRFAHGANGGNIGFHEIPFQYGRPVQSIAQLGQPLSGGCVRQALPDAQWMWNWAGIGTVVVVTP